MKLNFLVPIDFLPESESALAYAATVVKQISATLHLVHIIEEESPIHRLIISNEQRDMIKRGAKDKLDELAGRILAPAKIDFTTRVLKGKIYNQIIYAVGELKADLIFMGRTDSSDVKKNFTGTNTMHIIMESKVPVITLRKIPASTGCSNIILPLDLTKQTIKKASNAIRAARMLKAGITVVSFLPDERKSIEIKFIQRLDQIRTIFEKLEISCQVKLVSYSSDDPFERLNNTARELEGDLIMIMTQQEMNFKEFFIGSHAQEVINKSEFPVLSINPLTGEKAGIPDSMSEVFINPIQMLDY